MDFYDEKHNPMIVGNILAVGKQFAIAELSDYSGENILGLFTEDDDNYFLVTEFSSYWLSDLEDVVRKSRG